jgi:hypothetical protein
MLLTYAHGFIFGSLHYVCITFNVELLSIKQLAQTRFPQHLLLFGPKVHACDFHTFTKIDACDDALPVTLLNPARR